MPIVPPEEITQANALLESVRDEWLRRPGVTAVDLGFKWSQGEMTPQIAVRVHVRRKKPLAELSADELFPREVNGVPVDVLEANYQPGNLTGTAQLAAAANNRAQRFDEIPLGVSVGGPLVSAGSLGAIVADNQTGQEMILSNWHVLANSLNPQPGQVIWQPGRVDGGGENDSFAELSRWLLGPYDAAVARLTGERSVKPETVEGRVFGPPRRPMLGMTVWKSSRTTGLTYGFIDGVQMQISLDYPSVGPRQLQQAFRVIPHPDSGAHPGSGDLEVSAPGDSGAIWVEAESGQAVGLHFAGEVGDQPEFALAHDLIPVLERLDVRLVGALPAPVEPPAPDPIKPPIQPTPPPAASGDSFWSRLLAQLRRIFGG
jgi:hypothetical protein